MSKYAVATISYLLGMCTIFVFMCVFMCVFRFGTPTYVGVEGILSDENGDCIPCALVILSEEKRMGIHNLGLKQTASFSLLSFDSEYGANGMYALGIDAHSTDRRVYVFAYSHGYIPYENIITFKRGHRSEHHLDIVLKKEPQSK